MKRQEIFLFEIKDDSGRTFSFLIQGLLKILNLLFFSFKK